MKIEIKAKELTKQQLEILQSCFSEHIANDPELQKEIEEELKEIITKTV